MTEKGDHGRDQGAEIETEIGEEGRQADPKVQVENGLLVNARNHHLLYLKQIHPLRSSCGNL